MGEPATCAPRPPGTGVPRLSGPVDLSKRYPASRLNGACRLANQAGLVRLKHVRHILENNRDLLPDSSDTTTELPQDHENIRGRHHFH